MPQGQISKWVSGAEEGRISGDDGQEVGFSRYDLSDVSTADNLKEGDRVEYDLKESGVGVNVRFLS